MTDVRPRRILAFGLATGRQKYGDIQLAFTRPLVQFAARGGVGSVIIPHRLQGRKGISHATSQMRA